MPDEIANVGHALNDVLAQAYEQAPRDTWTRWLDALHRPAARALRIFEGGRDGGFDLT